MSSYTTPGENLTFQELTIWDKTKIILKEHENEAFPPIIAELKEGKHFDKFKNIFLAAPLLFDACVFVDSGRITIQGANNSPVEANKKLSMALHKAKTGKDL